VKGKTVESRRKEKWELLKPQPECGAAIIKLRIETKE